MTSCFSTRQDSVCARMVACSLEKPGCAVSPVASLGTSLNCCASGKESACQCRRCKRLGFNPWVEEIPWRRKWRPPPVFLSRDFHGQRRLAGYSPGVAQSQTQLSDGHTHSAPSAPRVRGRCAHAPAHKPSPGAQLLQRCSSGGDSKQRHLGSMMEHLHYLWEPFLLDLPPALRSDAAQPAFASTSAAPGHSLLGDPPGPTKAVSLCTPS